MPTLHIQDYRGYQIVFTNISGIRNLVLTDSVVPYLIVHVTSIVNNHPSIKAINDFKVLVDTYLDLNN